MEYRVLFPDEPHEDVIRVVSDREHGDPAFVRVERMVDTLFDQLGVGVEVRQGLSYAGERPDATARFSGDIIEPTAFDQRPA